MKKFWVRQKCYMNPIPIVDFINNDNEKALAIAKYDHLSCM